MAAILSQCVDARGWEIIMISQVELPYQDRQSFRSIDIFLELVSMLKDTD